MGFTTPSNYSTVDATVRLLGLGRQDSNLRSRDQNPVPCRLATPQRARRPSLFVSATPSATPRLYRSYLCPSWYAGRNRHLTEALPHRPPVRKPPRRAPAAHSLRLALPLRCRRCRKRPYRSRSSRPPKRPRAVALLPAPLPPARDP